MNFVLVCLIQPNETFLSKTRQSYCRQSARAKLTTEFENCFETTITLISSLGSNLRVRRIGSLLSSLIASFPPAVEQKLCAY